MIKFKAMIPRQTRRFLSTISSVRGTFPPPEAFSKVTQTKPFNPKVWASLQPPTATAVNAFASRLRLFDTHASTSSSSASTSATSTKAIPNIPQLLTQALTHESILDVHTKELPTEPIPKTNKELDQVGNALLGLFAAEYVNATYPHLPTRTMMAAVTAYVGPQTCADLTKEWGVARLLRWSSAPREGDGKSTMLSDAFASVPRSIIALAYQHQSIAHARELAHKWFFSRKVDLRPLIKFHNPMKALADTAKAFGRERPLSRLLKETGRLSLSPVYVVGVFSGSDKLGEGFGSSLRMAEYRAAEDALHRLYLTQTPPGQYELPSSTFSPRTDLDPFANLLEPSPRKFVPTDLGESEVLYGAAVRNRSPRAEEGVVRKQMDL